MLLNYLMNSMDEGKVNSFQTRKKEVNFQNFLQGFYKVQHCLNNVYLESTYNCLPEKN